MADRVGVAGVVAALSVVSDLTRGRPAGEAMRACLLATELWRRAGSRSATGADVYYATLMRFAGCPATSHEAAMLLGGDDIAVRSRGDLVDASRPWEGLMFLAGLGSGVDRLRVMARAPVMGRTVRESARADCEVGAELVQRVRLPDAVSRSVLCAFERYDGKGSPAGLAGDDVAEPARFAAVGFAAVMFDAIGGAELATRMLARWAGRALDPAITHTFAESPDELLAMSAPEDVWASVVAREPQPPRYFRDDAHLDETLAGYGDAADLKAPCFQGHSRSVAELARDAAGELGIDPSAAYRAGLLHDLGRVTVPTGIWERPGPLRPEEWELVRLHPYHSGRILSRAPVLAGLATTVSRHHERIDGSGYPSGMRGADLDAASRLLAAADAWCTLRESRPHRAALGPADASRAIASLPLDHTAVRAVLRAAEAPHIPRPSLPADLTEREAQVLGLLAGGLTKRQIAARLFISPATVHTHTVHIYAKCEVSTRAGLAMYAMRHGLSTDLP